MNLASQCYHHSARLNASVSMRATQPHLSWNQETGLKAYSDIIYQKRKSQDQCHSGGRGVVLWVEKAQPIAMIRWWINSRPREDHQSGVEFPFRATGNIIRFRLPRSWTLRYAYRNIKITEYLLKLRHVCRFRFQIPVGVH